jgi:hypothetical protein
MKTETVESPSASVRDGSWDEREGPPLDARTLLEALSRHGVDDVVIGAWDGRRRDP